MSFLLGCDCDERRWHTSAAGCCLEPAPALSGNNMLQHCYLAQSCSRAPSQLPELPELTMRKNSNE